MSESQGNVSRSQNADGSTTLSMKLSEMSVEQLTEISQALGRKIDELKTQRHHLRSLIDVRLREGRKAEIIRQMASLKAELDATAPTALGQVDVVAPGAVVEVKAAGDA